MTVKELLLSGSIKQSIYLFSIIKEPHTLHHFTQSLFKAKMAPDLNMRWQDQKVVKEDGEWTVDGYVSHLTAT